MRLFAGQNRGVAVTKKGLRYAKSTTNTRRARYRYSTARVLDNKCCGSLAGRLSFYHHLLLHALPLQPLFTFPRRMNSLSKRRKYKILEVCVRSRVNAVAIALRCCYIRVPTYLGRYVRSTAPCKGKSFLHHEAMDFQCLFFQ